VVARLSVGVLGFQVSVINDGLCQEASLLVFSEASFSVNELAIVFWQVLSGVDLISKSRWLWLACYRHLPLYLENRLTANFQLDRSELLGQFKPH